MQNLSLRCCSLNFGTSEWNAALAVGAQLFLWRHHPETKTSANAANASLQSLKFAAVAKLHFCQKTDTIHIVCN